MGYAKHGSIDYASRTAAGCEAASEPVFLLRASDKHAAETVRYWASMAKSSELRGEALKIADEMDAFSSNKEPD